MTPEPDRTTIALAESCQAWGTAEAWATALGVTEEALRQRLEGRPSWPVWVRLEEFSYLTEAYDAKTVAQECEGLPAPAASSPHFALASEEVLDHAKAVAQEVLKRVNRALVSDDAQNCIPHCAPPSPRRG